MITNPALLLSLSLISLAQCHTYSPVVSAITVLNAATIVSNIVVFKSHTTLAILQLLFISTSIGIALYPGLYTIVYTDSMTFVSHMLSAAAFASVRVAAD